VSVYGFRAAFSTAGISVGGIDAARTGEDRFGAHVRRASPLEESRYGGFDPFAGVVPFPLLLAGISGPLDPLPLKGFFPDPHDHRRSESGGEASISRTNAVTKPSGRSSHSRTSAGVAGERTEIQRRAGFDPGVARGRLRHDHATPCTTDRTPSGNRCGRI
jgi:hypothetical protein